MMWETQPMLKHIARIIRNRGETILHMAVYVPDFKQFYKEHHSYLKAYKEVNAFIEKLCKLPPRLVSEAGKVLENIDSENPLPHSPYQMNIPSHFVIDFMDRLDSFTYEVIGLFNVQRKQVNDTRIYVRKVSAVKSKYQNRNLSETTSEYRELVKLMSDLITRLNWIEQKAGEITLKLEKLDQEWDKILSESTSQTAGIPGHR